MGWFFGASEECRLHHSMLDEIVSMLLVQRWEIGRSAEMIQETYDSSELFKFVRGQREFWQRACRIADAKRKVRVYTISMPNNEAQFLETRKFQVNEVCRIYRVPPHLIGDLEHATFSNIEHQSISFAVHTIRPWLVRIEQAFNRALFPEKEKGRFYSQFVLDGLMRGDYKSRMEGYAIARQNGWMCTNDIRELENMNPIPEEDGGNLYLVNGNMIPIKGIASVMAGGETK